MIRWLKGARECGVVVIGDGLGEEANQLNYPISLLFDRENHLPLLIVTIIEYKNSFLSLRRYNS